MKEPMVPCSNSPQVCVVVTTRNNERTIEACLKSIREQTYPNFELIVVDNFSWDRTPEIARLFANVFCQAGPERSAQRNLGAMSTNARYVYFVDSDMELSPQVLEECVREALLGRIAVIIPELATGQGFWARCKALEKQCYLGDDDMEAARFVDRERFISIGGYDGRMVGGGEDWDMSQRLLSKFCVNAGRIRSVAYHNEGNLTLGETLRKKYYYGRTILVYRTLNRDKAKAQLRLIRPAFLSHRNLLIREPLLALGMIFMKTLEFVAGGLGAMASKFTGQDSLSVG